MILLPRASSSTGRGRGPAILPRCLLKASPPHCSKCPETDTRERERRAAGLATYRAPSRASLAAVVLLSGALLLYTAAVVPVQLFMWDYEDPCNKFPTLYFDVAADSFFLVRVAIFLSPCLSLTPLAPLSFTDPHRTP